LAGGYEGLAEIEGGLHLAERHGLAVTALRARNNLGIVLSRGDPRAALESDRVGLAEARRLGRRSHLTFLTNSAEGATWTGDWDWALAELDEPLAGDLEQVDRILMLEAAVRLRAWRGEPVDELVDEVERLAREASDPTTLYSATIVHADRALALEELEEAATAYRRAAVLSAGNAPNSYTLAARASLLLGDAAAAAAYLAALEATGAHGSLIEARRISIGAGLAALDGRPADALSLYRDAIGRFRDLGMPLDEAFTAIEMASLLGPAEPDVGAAANAAREILTRLGAKPFLERLEAAMTRPSPASGEAGSDAAVATPAQATQTRS